MSKTVSKIEGIFTKALPVVAGVMITGLVIRYGGDLPVVKDVKLGLKGDVAGKLFS